ncbi:hypothetical protein JTB14_005423 [Gonioctena quinquepunctata]|nr:hypothetical protein JTB14_005423 [Gonioctena quinquepunctata]
MLHWSRKKKWQSVRACSIGNVVQKYTILKGGRFAKLAPRGCALLEHIHRDSSQSHQEKVQETKKLTSSSTDSHAATNKDTKRSKRSSMPFFPFKGE